MLWGGGLEVVFNRKFVSSGLKGFSFFSNCSLFVFLIPRSYQEHQLWTGSVPRRGPIAHDHLQMAASGLEASKRARVRRLIYNVVVFGHLFTTSLCFLFMYWISITVIVDTRVAVTTPSVNASQQLPPISHNSCRSWFLKVDRPSGRSRKNLFWGLFKYYLTSIYHHILLRFMS